MSRNVIYLGAALALAACAQPLAPTLSSSDETTWSNQVTALGALGTGAALPTTSTATYSGLVGASLSDVGTLLAEIELTADFANDGISGIMQDANILNSPSSDLPDQSLKGSIDLTGSIDRPNKALAATGTGVLTAVGKAKGFGVNINLDMTVDVDGTFRTSNGTDMDTITGTVDISGTASGPFGSSGGSFSGTGADFYAEEQ